tara:strand:+ start:76 stop:201 length:126 start_codon:yes stop_codon:yes gene_type:complete
VGARTIRDINSLNQWSVELGRVLAKAILKDVKAGLLTRLPD